MKLATFITSLAITLAPALLASAQQTPARLPMANYGTSLAAGTYEGETSYGHAALTNCQCDNRKGYDLWCRPVSFLDIFGSKAGSCCGHRPAPTCCAPEPTCAPPAPTCCAPEPTCIAPAPTCCAPEPKCCAPEPKCCAPEPSCGAPCGCACSSGCSKRLFHLKSNPLSDLHAKLQSLFTCKKCSKSNCGCTDSGCSDCGCAGGGPSPMYFQPSAPSQLPALPDTIDNPFRDDAPASSIPVPETTTSTRHRSMVKPVYYAR